MTIASSIKPLISIGAIIVLYSKITMMLQYCIQFIGRGIAVGDRMFLGMQDFDFAQISP